MAEKGLKGKRRDKYPALRGLLGKELGSVYGFSKQAGICRSVVTRVIQGDRKEARTRIADAIRRLRPDADITGIWQRPSNGAPKDAALRRRLRQSRVQRAVELEEETRI